MRKYIFALTFFMSCTFMMMAQNNQQNRKPSEKKPSFEQFMNDRISFMLEEVNLSANDSARFVPVYKEWQNAKFALMKKYMPSRKLFRKGRKASQNDNGAIPDSVYLKAVESEYKRDCEEASLDMKYFEKFKKILTPRQLFEFRMAENKFKEEFMHGLGSRKPDGKAPAGDRPHDDNGHRSVQNVNRK